MASQLTAQSRLIGVRSVALGVAYESWSFSDGVRQPTQSGENDVVIDRASQVSFPLWVSIPVGEAWTIDLSTAYSTGKVTLDGTDPELGLSRYSLSGLTDARLRATGRLSPAITLTLGLNAPTGSTSLTSEEYGAFRVLAAPALSFQVARLGNGFSGTAGIVVSKRLGGMWAGALGASYELHGSYDPGTLLAVLSNPDYSPSDALRFSLGVDGPVGQHAMTLGLSADFYPNQDRIRDPSFGDGRFVTTQLGPVLTADWQLRIAAPRFRELTFYIVDRYRTDYGTGASGSPTVAVDNSSGNYLDAGIRSVIASGPATGILAAVNFRHQTGLDSDQTIATARMVSAAVTLGVARDIGGGFSVQPFVRGQIGRIRSDDVSTSATGFAGGVTIGRRF
ncbi:MAG TPA: hypothetical protein VIG08_00915 [Gemmatimonadales bacterium]